MFNFKKVLINPQTRDEQSYQAIVDSLKLVYKHKNQLFDDFYSEPEKPCWELLLAIIEKHSPFFWGIYEAKTGKYAGFAYLYGIIGSQNRMHSATVSTCFEKSFWGKPSRVIAKKFLSYCFKKYDLNKIKAETFSSNPYATSFLRSLGFEKEGCLKNETIVAKRPIDLNLWAISKDKHLSPTAKHTPRGANPTTERKSK